MIKIGRTEPFVAQGHFVLIKPKKVITFLLWICSLNLCDIFLKQRNQAYLVMWFISVHYYKIYCILLADFTNLRQYGNIEAFLNNFWEKNCPVYFYVYKIRNILWNQFFLLDQQFLLFWHYTNQVTKLSGFEASWCLYTLPGPFL